MHCTPRVAPADSSGAPSLELEVDVVAVDRLGDDRVEFGLVGDESFARIHDRVAQPRRVQRFSFAELLKQIGVSDIRACANHSCGHERSFRRDELTIGLYNIHYEMSILYSTGLAGGALTKVV